MKLSESFIASIKEKYGNPATIEDLFMVLTQDLSQAYDVNPEEKEAILELIKELPGGTQMQETIKNELYYVLQRKECMNKLLLDTEQWRAKKIERYYDDEEQQINFEANAMNIFLRGIELFNALAKKLIGDFTVRMFTYLEENIGKQDTISLDHIAFLRQFLFSTTRLVKDPNVIEQILGSTKFTRQDLVLMSVNGEERKTMDYTGIGPFLVGYALEGGEFGELIKALKAIQKTTNDILMEVAPRSKFSQHFGTYMQIYEERKKVGVLIDSYGVEKHISVLKSK